MQYPEIILDGKVYDIYDVAQAFGITSPPLFNAFKKIIRRGTGSKSEQQDLNEAKQSIDRYLRDQPMHNTYDQNCDCAKCLRIRLAIKNQA